MESYSESAKLGQSKVAGRAYEIKTCRTDSKLFYITP